MPIAETLNRANGNDGHLLKLRLWRHPSAETAGTETHRMSAATSVRTIEWLESRSPSNGLSGICKSGFAYTFHRLARIFCRSTSTEPGVPGISVSGSIDRSGY
jgi:hypothetical protein